MMSRGIEAYLEVKAGECRNMLYCIVWYCICIVFVLYCIVLYCIVLYCIVLYCIVLYCIVLYCVNNCALYNHKYIHK